MPEKTEFDELLDRIRKTGEETRRTLDQIKQELAERKRAEAQAFAQKWLPAWSGNDPELLASFYAEDALYLDPTIPDGLRGRPALLEHFRALLAANPDAKWTQTEAIPVEDGFLYKCLVKMPVRTTELTGALLVQFDDAGKIRRNEVYFDRSRLLEGPSLIGP